MHNRKLWFGLAALAAAWCFDLLFWGQRGGITFLIWTALLLVLGYVLAWHEKKKPSVWSIVLTVLILGFAVIPAWRSEGFTRFSSIMVTLLGLLLLISTFLDGYWPHFRFADYFMRMVNSIGAGVVRGFGLLSRNDDGVPPLPGQKTGFRRLGSVLLGLVMALPVVIMLAAILASADPIFSDMLQKMFALERLPEYLFRFTYIVIGAYVLIGFYVHAILPKSETVKPDVQQASVKPFLGWTECAIILGAVDLLFILFVTIQVKYLFGGVANINATGYTYSEYARRGFGELVAVAVISLAIYLVLHSITKLESKAKQIGFTFLSVVMLAMVLVMLASSLQRLMLYESAYSFSELRTYTHVFIFWLAALIVATIVFEIVRRQGRFGLALMLMVIGFTATLGIMNVDGFIARQNIKLGDKGGTNENGQLDLAYIGSLSSDAIPAMIEAYNDPAYSEETRSYLGASLACRADRFFYVKNQDWRSIRFGELHAYNLLMKNKDSWSQFPITTNSAGTRSVQVGDTIDYCSTYDWTYMD